METKELVITIIFSILGSFVCFSLLLLLACFCYQKQRRKRRLDDDNESLQSILQEQQKQYQYVAPIAKKPILRNGLFNFKTSLHRTRSVGASVSASLASLPLPVAPSSTSPVPPTPVRAGAGRRASDFQPTRYSTPLPTSSSSSRTTGVMPLTRPVSASASSAGINGVGTSGSATGGCSGSSGAVGAVGGAIAITAGAAGIASSSTGGGASGASAQTCDRNAASNPQNKSLASLKNDHPSMAFWQTRSISLVDMYIDNSEPTENVGQIQFSLEYDFDNTTLILKIMQAKEIPAKDMSGTSDPYVRVTLLPDKKHRLETKIKRRTLHPRWNETFYFEGFPIQKLQSRVLHLHVFDYDRFSRDDSIGEVFLPLCQVDFSDKPVFWKALKPPLKDKCGEVLISLSYHPTNSILTLTALKARNLKAKDINGKSDPYVKVWLQFGDKRVEKRKTPVYKCTLEPVFNETFTFDVPWEKIRECSLDIRVMDFDNIGRNELIGRILLAAKNSTGASETKHWQDMIAKPRQAVVQWHRLKPE